MFSLSNMVVAIAFEVAFCYYYFVGNRHALLFYYKHQQHSLGNAHHRKFLFSICDFLRYVLKNGRPIPSTSDMHASTPMLLEHSLDNKWLTSTSTGFCRYMMFFFLKLKKVLSFMVVYLVILVFAEHVILTITCAA